MLILHHVFTQRIAALFALLCLTSYAIDVDNAQELYDALNGTATEIVLTNTSTAYDAANVSSPGSQNYFIISRSGTSSNPIFIRANGTPSSAANAPTLESSLVIEGNYVVVENLNFSGDSGTDFKANLSGDGSREAAIEIYAGSGGSVGDYNIIRGCWFTDVMVDNVVRIGDHGDYNIVEYCYFKERQSGGSTLALTYYVTDYAAGDYVDGAHGVCLNNVIRYCHFDAKYPGSTTGGAIRMGRSDDDTLRYTNWTIEYCLFTDVDGNEMIENKSSGNTYRYLTFIDCDAKVQMRIGNSNTLNAIWMDNTRGIFIRGVGTISNGIKFVNSGSNQKFRFCAGSVRADEVTDQDGTYRKGEKNYAIPGISGSTSSKHANALNCALYNYTSDVSGRIVLGDNANYTLVQTVGYETENITIEGVDCASEDPFSGTCSDIVEETGYVIESSISVSETLSSGIPTYTPIELSSSEVGPAAMGSISPAEPDPIEGLVPVSITASGDSGGYVPLNTMDSDWTATSRWSSEGDGEWIEYDLGQNYSVDEVKIGWYLSDTRVWYYDIEVKAEGGSWSTVVSSGSSNGTSATNAFESVTFSSTTARYIRYVGHGNDNSNYWNSIVELSIIEASNSTPVANDDAYSEIHDSLWEVTDSVLNNDTDADSDPLTATKVTDIDNRVVLDPDGTFTYMPATGFVGAYTFTYTATDGTCTSEPATVTLTTTNTAPVGVADSYNTPMNTTLNVSAPGLLTNDTDAETDPLTASKVANPSDGTVTVNADGSFEYIPDTSFVGSDSFTYKANDGITDSSTTTVTINVTGLTPTEGLVPVSVSASDESGVYVAENTMNDDYDPTSRWSADGDGEWIEYDLGADFSIDEVKIAWYLSNVRVWYYDIQVKADGAGSWTTVVSSGESSGTSAVDAYESITFTAATARYVRYVGHGNDNSNYWNSLVEVAIIEADATNLADNGDMEDGTTSWTGSGSGVSVSSNTSIVHGGSKSLKAVGRTAYYHGARQDVTAEISSNGPGNYDYSCWMYNTGSTDTGKLTLKLITSNGNHYYTLTASATGSSWVEISGTKNITWTGTLNTAYLEGRLDNETADYYLDDVVLTKQ